MIKLRFIVIIVLSPLFIYILI